MGQGQLSYAVRRMLWSFSREGGIFLYRVGYPYHLPVSPAMSYPHALSCVMCVMMRTLCSMRHNLA